MFTNLLLERGVCEEDLALVEQHAEFAATLLQRYPAAKILSLDASMIRHHSLGDEKFGAAISGLPLLSMPSRKIAGILVGIFRVLGQNGKFYQFTYGLRCPVPRRILDRLGLKAVCIGWTAHNIPPAAVYRISKRRFSLERISESGG